MRLKSILLETYQKASDLLSQVKEDENWLKSQRIEIPPYSEIYHDKRGNPIGGFFRLRDDYEDSNRWCYIEPLQEGRIYNAICFKYNGKIDYICRSPTPNMIGAIFNGTGFEPYRTDGPAVIRIYEDDDIRYSWIYDRFSAGAESRVGSGRVPLEFIGYVVRDISFKHQHLKHQHPYGQEMLDEIIEAMTTLYINGYVNKDEIYSEMLEVMRDIEKRDKAVFDDQTEFTHYTDDEYYKGFQEIELKYEKIIAEVEAWYRS